MNSEKVPKLASYYRQIAVLNTYVAIITFTAYIK